MHDAAAVFACLVALVLAAAYQACRVGYAEASLRPVVITLGVGWFLINFGAGARRLAPPLRAGTSWMASEGALTAAGLVAVVAAGTLLGSAAALPLAAAGVLLATARAVVWLRNEAAGRACVLLFFACLVGVSAAGRLWGESLLNPLFPQLIAQGGGHHDELFHVSVSNMLRVYHVASTGLDGLPYMPYHTGSHFVLAQLGVLMHQTGLEVYNLAFPVIFVPLLFYAVFLAGLGLGRGTSAPTTAALTLVGLVLASMVTRVVPLTAGFPSGLWEDTMTTESMCLAMVVLLLGLAAAAPVLCRPAEAVRPGWSAAGAAAVLAFPAFIAALGFLKISVMAVALAAAVVLFLTSAALRRSAPAWLAVALACAAAVGVYRLTNAPGYDEAIAAPVPFAFLRQCVAWDWRGYYFLNQALLLLAAAGLRLRQEGVRTVGELGRAVRAGGLRDLLFAAVVAAVGTLPGLIWPIPGGSAVYFFEIQRWVALAILVGALLSPSPAPAALWSGRLRDLPVWRLGAGFVLLSVFATMLINGYGEAHALLASNLDSRGFVAAPWAGPGAPERRARLTGALRRGNLASAYRLLREQAAVAEARADPAAQTVRALQALYWMPAEQKRRSVIYIPKTNRSYWDLFPARAPWDVPFVAAAVSGLASVNGLPEPKDLTTRFYGYYLYPVPPDEPRLRPEQAREAVVRKAAALGMVRVLVLDADAGGAPVLYEWPVPPAR